MCKSVNPEFLKYLDSDPDKVFKEFYQFAIKLLTQKTPRPMLSLLYDDKNDIIQEIIYSCVKDNFARLKKFKQDSKSFTSWFYVLAHNQTIDFYRKRNRTWEVERTTTNDEDKNLLDIFVNLKEDILKKYDLIELKQIVRNALNSMKKECQQLLEMAAHEFTPLEVVKFLRLPKEMNKSISNKLKHCRKILKDMLSTEGVVINDFLNN